MGAEGGAGAAEDVPPRARTRPSRAERRSRRRARAGQPRGGLARGQVMARAAQAAGGGKGDGRKR